MITLGLESSCDETAAAVLENGDRLLSSVVASQVSTHHDFGGVVPELASREHINNICQVVAQALSRAGLTFQSLDAIAVTQGPGLVGALPGGTHVRQRSGLCSGHTLRGSQPPAGDTLPPSFWRIRLLNSLPSPWSFREAIPHSIT